MNKNQSASNFQFVTGEWNGFYLEKHNENRGWMHLYLEFEKGSVRGEGTDYVGPWVLTGVFDASNGSCQWTKQYMGKHQVRYSGQLGVNGITGTWNIGGLLEGPFHIWPKHMTHLNEMYMTEDLEKQRPEGASPSVVLDHFSQPDQTV